MCELYDMSCHRLRRLVKASTNPGMFTLFFGAVKGQCELGLLESAKTTPSLKPYTIRPSYVDAANDPETLSSVHRPLRPIEHICGFLAPALRAYTPNLVSPTREVGFVATLLATGDGEKLESPDVEGEGWILTNRAIRRLVKEKQSVS